MRVCVHRVMEDFMKIGILQVNGIQHTLGTAVLLPQEQGIPGIKALAKLGHPQRGLQAPGRPE